jgi:GDPmannose 4,6-dehydratase
MKKKKALITGITGQDGSYLAELLLKKGYIVHGLKRRSSTINTFRINHLYKEKTTRNSKFILHHGDMGDSSSIYNLIKDIMPDEIYNLAAQSHVAVSFEQPEYTANADALGTLRILEAMRHLELKKTKLYQAGTSELFGGSKIIPQNEKTPFYPKSPYGVAKLYAHWIAVNYRESYNLFVSNGILFNHESPVRGETFITRKIIIGLCKIKKNKIKKIYVGNLYSKRDWGHAKDYVEAMWMILQQSKPDDFVIATGKQYSVKDFINLAAKELKMKIKWRGRGLKEKAYDENDNIIIECHKNYFRPSEVDNLLGDYKKAKRILGWKPKIDIKSLIKEMVRKDYDNL